MLKGLTIGGKIIVAIVLVALIFGIKWVITDSGLIPKKVKQSTVYGINDIPPLTYDKNANAPLKALPDTNTISEVSAPEWRLEVMEWNAQNGLFFANGGQTTMKSSLMEEQGIKLRINTQNDCSKQGEDLYSYIKDYSDGNTASTKGCQLIIWMGDGCPSYLAGLNDKIKKDIKNGSDYIVQPFCAFGASFGEDKAIYKNGSFKSDPQKLRGSLWIGVLRDGDWNILMKYAQLNNIPVNSEATTYDPDAINWMGVDDYLKAAEQYVAKVKETRKIIKNGKLTGKDTTITVDGCVTWTPGDKTAFEGRGGVTVASTKDFGAQMACTVLASKKWLNDNRVAVEKFILAGSLGGDQVKSHKSALKFACNVAQKIYNDKSMTPDLWYKYFLGIDVTNNDNGTTMTLGGSRVFNLNDQAEYYGLNGSTDKYKAVYETFGDLCVKAYPEIVPSYPKYEETIDLSYVTAAYTKYKSVQGQTTASTPEFKQGGSTEMVSKKSVSIEFAFGSVTIQQGSYATLQGLLKDFIVAENLYVTIEGHTDNVGNDASNMTLSQLRADAVKAWFVAKDAKFANKITSIGYGSTKPANGSSDVVAANANDFMRAKNRRVEIKLGR